MAKFSFTIYNNSICASILSFFGSAYLFLGMIFLIISFINADPDLDIITGIFLFITFALLGLLHMKLASVISQNKSTNDLITALETHGLDQQIALSTAFAIDIYNRCPTKKMEKYIGARNPQAFQLIRSKH